MVVFPLLVSPQKSTMKFECPVPRISPSSIPRPPTGRTRKTAPARVSHGGADVGATSSRSVQKWMSSSSTSKGSSARTRSRERALLNQNRSLNKKLCETRRGRIVQRNVTVTVASAVAPPRTSLHLERIFATGDTAATVSTIISGDDPVVLDNLDAGLLAPIAYHGPSFGGRVLRAGDHGCGHLGGHPGA